MSEELLRADLSPEQVSGVFARHGVLHISHETIYRHIWRNKPKGGTLHRHLRQRPKYRNAAVPTRSVADSLASAISPRGLYWLRIGHWEMDTVNGPLVERVTGCLLIGKLADHTKAGLNRRALPTHPEQRHLFKTISVCRSESR
jgi:IS30 family transposase